MVDFSSNLKYQQKQPIFSSRQLSPQKCFSSLSNIAWKVIKIKISLASWVNSPISFPSP